MTEIEPILRHYKSLAKSVALGQDILCNSEDTLALCAAVERYEAALIKISKITTPYFETDAENIAKNALEGKP